MEGRQPTQHNQPGLLGYLPNKAADLWSSRRGGEKRERKAEKRRWRTKRDESDCTMPHTLEAQSPLETVVAFGSRHDGATVWGLHFLQTITAESCHHPDGHGDSQSPGNRALKPNRSGESRPDVQKEAEELTEKAAKRERREAAEEPGDWPCTQGVGRAAECAAHTHPPTHTHFTSKDSVLCRQWRMKKHSARVAPLSSYSTQVLTCPISEGKLHQRDLRTPFIHTCVCACVSLTLRSKQPVLTQGSDTLITEHFKHPLNTHAGKNFLTRVQLLLAALSRHPSVSWPWSQVCPRSDNDRALFAPQVCRTLRSRLRAPYGIEHPSVSAVWGFSGDKTEAGLRWAVRAGGCVIQRQESVLMVPSS